MPTNLRHHHSAVAFVALSLAVNAYAGPGILEVVNDTSSAWVLELKPLPGVGGSGRWPVIAASSFYADEEDTGPSGFRKYFIPSRERLTAICEGCGGFLADGNVTLAKPSHLPVNDTCVLQEGKSLLQLKCSRVQVDNRAAFAVSKGQFLLYNATSDEVRIQLEKSGGVWSFAESDIRGSLANYAILPHKYHGMDCFACGAVATLRSVNGFMLNQQLPTNKTYEIVETGNAGFTIRRHELPESDRFAPRPTISQAGAKIYIVNGQGQEISFWLSADSKPSQREKITLLGRQGSLFSCQEINCRLAFPEDGEVINLIEAGQRYMVVWDMQRQRLALRAHSY